MNEKTIVRLIFALLILFNIQYIFYIVQIPFTLFFVDYKKYNTMSNEVLLLKNNVQELTKEHEVGFVSDVKEDNVLLEVSSIKNFYNAQYAIVPAILKNDTEHKYVIGMFDKNTLLEPGLEIYKKLNNNVYILKRRGM